jgi:hypothetical protein
MREPMLRFYNASARRFLKLALVSQLGMTSGCGKAGSSMPPPNETSTSPPARSAPDQSADQVDPIDRLAARLASSPLWENGLSPKIELPPTADAKQIVAAVFGNVSFEQGRVTRPTILRTRKVSIGEREYLATVVETNLGRKILLYQYQGPSIGWWTRVYEENSPRP